jgi:hypothetical protein
MGETCWHCFPETNIAAFRIEMVSWSLPTPALQATARTQKQQFGRIAEATMDGLQDWR